jgi:hypothetical protein
VGSTSNRIFGEVSLVIELTKSRQNCKGYFSSWVIISGSTEGLG